MTDELCLLHDKTYVAYTLGCKLNFAETSFAGKQLAEAGFRKAKAGEPVGVCLINTCSVTDTADKKGRQAIHRLTRQHPEAYVIVTGCYAQLKPDEVAAIEGVDLVLGKDTACFTPACSQDDRTRYFLKVQDGCDYYCTYCTIPLARGRSRNGAIADLVRMAEEAAAKGAKEIVLSGVNIGDFGKSTGEPFIDLLRALEAVSGIERYRISSIEPNLLTDEIIEFVAQSQKFAPHFHIPLQSGSDEVLKLMKRRYDTQLFAEKIARVKELMPHAFIGVDVIVGTRGETPELFEKTCRFLEQLDIAQLHVFTYSERAGTKALEIEHTVSPADKKARSERLHRLSDRKKEAFYRSQTGRTLRVLWEERKQDGQMHGFTENYVRAEAPYDHALTNKLQEVVLGNFNTERNALVIHNL